MSKKVNWTEEMKQKLRSLYKDNTYKEMSSIVNKKFNVKTSANMVRKAYERYKYPVKIIDKPKGPKMLVFDIETAPMKAFVWKLWDNNVGLNMIDSDWYVLSWAAKWYGTDEVIYQDQRGSKDIENDKKLLKGIWKLLDEADIVITQNGKRFDTKKLNARFILNGMQPPSSYRNIDTLILAKRHFGFTSNKLAYMTDKLCTKYKKLNHAKFSGFELWNQCLQNNPEAWEEMEQYNRYDVLSLEELYDILIPWDTSLNFNTYHDEDEYRCTCGSTEFKKSGFYHTNASKFQKYKCVDCGAEVRDKKNLLDKDKRKNMLSGTSRVR